MPAALPALSEWGNFYVITGSAAAALTGLQFVVIALRPEAIAEAEEGAVRAFGSPTVTHFCGVLLVSAALSFPRHTAFSLALIVGGTGLAGLAFTIRVAIQARRQRTYTPVLSDWLWHVGMPPLAYASFAAAAAMLWRRPGAALDLVAVASLLLLFIGIRNAWDAAVWVTVKRG
jgi:hypothetical protein